LLAKFGIYAWCADGCVAGVCMWQKQKGIDQPVHFVFEAGTAGSGQFDAILQTIYRDEQSRRTHHLAGWSFAGKDTIPLQAADTVAYEFFKFVNNEIVEKNKRRIRLSAQNLFRQHELALFRHFNQKSFETFLERWDGTI
jgi:hypothetical protein